MICTFVGGSPLAAPGSFAVTYLAAQAKKKTKENSHSETKI